MSKNTLTKITNNLFIKDTRDRELKNKDDVPYIDHDWISDNFMIGSLKIDEPYDTTRFFSIANNKFVDTSLGGNISLNCYPQFTRYSDIRAKGILTGRNSVRVGDYQGNYGMGRYYAEAIDDNSTNVYFEFGVREFNNILFYLMSAVDYKKSVIANSGRSPLFYTGGWIFGTGALIIAFPILTPLLLISKFAASTALDVFTTNGRFSQYYLKPTMFLYWSTVNSLVTMMATELGLLSPVFMEDEKDKSKVGVPVKLDEDDMDAMRKLMPGLITTNNGINVHAMVSKSQILYNKYHEAKIKVLEKLSSQSLKPDDIKKLNETIPFLDLPDEPNLWEKLQNILPNNEAYSKENNKDDTFKQLIEELKKGGNELIEAFSPDNKGMYNRKLRKEDTNSWLSTAKQTAKTVFDEGARFSIFRVEHLGSSTESFSNETTNIGIGDKINAAGDKVRDIRFNLGNGNIPGIDTIVGAVTGFAVGALSGVTMGLSDTIAGFLSGANIEVPKRWSNSSVSLPTHTFKMTLISPSAHPIAQLRNIYIPLASILAGALPLSTGPSSHTSPYLCSMYVRGHQRITLGMITSVSITRGTSNLPFNKQRRPLAIEVSFTVTDFSEVINAPVVSNLLDTRSVAFNDESGISKYIQALCARDLYSTVHVMDRAKIKLSKVFQDLELETTPEYWGSRVGDTFSNVGLFSVFGNRKAINYSELE